MYHLITTRTSVAAALVVAVSSLAHGAAAAPAPAPAKSAAAPTPAKSAAAPTPAKSAAAPAPAKAAAAPASARSAAAKPAVAAPPKATPAPAPAPTPTAATPPAPAPVPPPADAKEFPHGLHLEQGAECKTCHQPQAAGTPKVELGACNDCHSDGPPPFRFQRPRPLWAAFPHPRHDKTLDCKPCHADIVEGQYKPGQPVLGRDGCVECHRASKVEVPRTACVRCHGIDARKAQPKDHDETWPLRHGLAALGRVFDEHGRDCKDCHGSDACTRCHNVVMPRSHTGLWRVRTHGLAAGWDRDRCKTCHETGVCVRCHATERPLNHAGDWARVHGLAAAATDNEHCAACHRASFCVDCHSQRR